MDLSQHNQIVEQLNIKYIDEIEELKREISKYQYVISNIVKELNRLKKILKIPEIIKGKKMCFGCGVIKEISSFRLVKKGRKRRRNYCYICEKSRVKVHKKKCKICGFKFRTKHVRTKHCMKCANIASINTKKLKRRIKYEM